MPRFNWSPVVRSRFSNEELERLEQRLPTDYLGWFQSELERIDLTKALTPTGPGYGTPPAPAGTVGPPLSPFDPLPHSQMPQVQPPVPPPQQASPFATAQTQLPSVPMPASPLGGPPQSPLQVPAEAGYATQPPPELPASPFEVQQRSEAPPPTDPMGMLSPQVARGYQDSAQRLRETWQQPPSPQPVESAADLRFKHGDPLIEQGSDLKEFVDRIVHGPDARSRARRGGQRDEDIELTTEPQREGIGAPWQFGQGPEAPPEQEPEDQASALRWARDFGIDITAGGAGAGLSWIAGVLNTATGGLFGRGMSRAFDAMGGTYNPEFLGAWAESFYSTTRKRKEEEFQRQSAQPGADFSEQIADTIRAGLQNPEIALASAVKSIPLVGVIALGAKGVGAAAGALAAGRAATWLGGRVGNWAGAVARSTPTQSAISEGALSGGLIAEDIAKDVGYDEFGLKEAVSALVGGAGTGIAGRLGARAAEKLGVSDPDVVLADILKAAAQGRKAVTPQRGGIIAGTGRLARSALAEGIFEELPQSVQEQILTNVGTGKPVLEGVPQAAVLGTFAGAAMGGMFQGVQPSNWREVSEPAIQDKQMQTPVPATPEPTTPAEPEGHRAPANTFSGMGEEAFNNLPPQGQLDALVEDIRYWGNLEFSSEQASLGEFLDLDVGVPIEEIKQHVGDARTRLVEFLKANGLDGVPDGISVEDIEDRPDLVKVYDGDEHIGFVDADGRTYMQKPDEEDGQVDHVGDFGTRDFGVRNLVDEYRGTKEFTTPKAVETPASDDEDPEDPLEEREFGDGLTTSVTPDDDDPGREVHWNGERIGHVEDYGQGRGWASYHEDGLEVSTGVLYPDEESAVRSIYDSLQRQQREAVHDFGDGLTTVPVEERDAPEAKAPGEDDLPSVREVQLNGEKIGTVYQNDDGAWVSNANDKMESPIGELGEDGEFVDSVFDTEEEAARAVREFAEKDVSDGTEDGVRDFGDGIKTKPDPYAGEEDAVPGTRIVEVADQGDIGVLEPQEGGGWKVFDVNGDILGGGEGTVFDDEESAVRAIVKDFDSGDEDRDEYFGNKVKTSPSKDVKYARDVFVDDGTENVWKKVGVIRQGGGRSWFIHEDGKLRLPSYRNEKEAAQALVDEWKAKEKERKKKAKKKTTKKKETKKPTEGEDSKTRDFGDGLTTVESENPILRDVFLDGKRIGGIRAVRGKWVADEIEGRESTSEPENAMEEKDAVRRVHALWRGEESDERTFEGIDDVWTVTTKADEEGIDKDARDVMMLDDEGNEVLIGRVLDMGIKGLSRWAADGIHEKGGLFNWHSTGKHPYERDAVQYVVNHAREALEKQKKQREQDADRKEKQSRESESALDDGFTLFPDGYSEIVLYHGQRVGRVAKERKTWTGVSGSGVEGGASWDYRAYGRGAQQLGPDGEERSGHVFREREDAIQAIKDSLDDEARGEIKASSTSYDFPQGRHRMSDSIRAGEEVTGEWDNIYEGVYTVIDESDKKRKRLLVKAKGHEIGRISPAPHKRFRAISFSGVSLTGKEPVGSLEEAVRRVVDDYGRSRIDKDKAFAGRAIEVLVAQTSKPARTIRKGLQTVPDPSHGGRRKVEYEGKLIGWVWIKSGGRKLVPAEKGYIDLRYGWQPEANVKGAFRGEKKETEDEAAEAVLEEWEKASRKKKAEKEKPDKKPDKKPGRTYYKNLTPDGETGAVWTEQDIEEKDKRAVFYFGKKIGTVHSERAASYVPWAEEWRATDTEGNFRYSVTGGILKDEFMAVQALVVSLGEERLSDIQKEMTGKRPVPKIPDNVTYEEEATHRDGIGMTRAVRLDGVIIGYVKNTQRVSKVRRVRLSAWQGMTVDRKYFSQRKKYDSVERVVEVIYKRHRSVLGVKDFGDGLKTRNPATEGGPWIRIVSIPGQDGKDVDIGHLNVVTSGDSSTFQPTMYLPDGKRVFNPIPEDDQQHERTAAMALRNTYEKVKDDPWEVRSFDSMPGVRTLSHKVGRSSRNALFFGNEIGTVSKRGSNWNSSIGARGIGSGFLTEEEAVRSLMDTVTDAQRKFMIENPNHDEARVEPIGAAEEIKAREGIPVSAPTDLPKGNDAVERDALRYTSTEASRVVKDRKRHKFEGGIDTRPAKEKHEKESGARYVYRGDELLGLVSLTKVDGSYDVGTKTHEYVWAEHGRPGSETFTSEEDAAHYVASGHGKEPAEPPGEGDDASGSDWDAAQEETFGKKPQTTPPPEPGPDGKPKAKGKMSAKELLGGLAAELGKGKPPGLQIGFGGLEYTDEQWNNIKGFINEIWRRVRREVSEAKKRVRKFMADVAAAFREVFDDETYNRVMGPMMTQWRKDTKNGTLVSEETDDGEEVPEETTGEQGTAGGGQPGGGGDRETVGGGGSEGAPPDGEGGDAGKGGKKRVRSEPRSGDASESAESADDKSGSTASQSASAGAEAEGSPVAYTDGDVFDDAAQGEREDVPTGPAAVERRDEVYEGNMRAFKLVVRLDRENRPPTQEERKILAQYRGWQFDSLLDWNQTRWIETRLTSSPAEKHWWEKTGSDERASVRSAAGQFYTFDVWADILPTVIEHYGLDARRILVPGAGTGHVLAHLPPDVRAAAQITAIEADPIAAAIARHLFPATNVDVIAAGYESEQAYQQPGGFDLVVTHVPADQDMRSVSMSERRHVDKDAFDATDDITVPESARGNVTRYFIAKALQHTRENGVAALIVPRSFLDDKNGEFRREVAKIAEIVTQARLPEQAFLADGLVGYVADVIVFRKLPFDVASSLDPAWTNAALIQPQEKGADGIVALDREHPDVAKRTTRVRDKDVSVVDEGLGHVTPLFRGEESQFGVVGTEAHSGKQADQEGRHLVNYRVVAGDPPARPQKGEEPHVRGEFDRARLREVLRSGSRWSDDEPYEGPVVEVTPQPYDYVVVGDHVESLSPTGSTIPLTGDFELNDRQQARAVAMVGVHDEVRRLISLMRDAGSSDADIAAAKVAVRRAHAEFQSRHGNLNDYANRSVYEPSTTSHQLFSLEVFEQAEEGGAVDFVGLGDLVGEGRLVNPINAPMDTSTPRAVAEASLGRTGKLDWTWMAAQADVSVDKLKRDLVAEGLVFERPDGVFEWHTKYLAGNIREKLRAAEEAAKKVSRIRFQKNVDALRERMPTQYTKETIRTRAGAPWVTERHLRYFIQMLWTGNTTVADSGSVKQLVGLLPHLAKLSTRGDGDWVFRWLRGRSRDAQRFRENANRHEFAFEYTNDSGGTSTYGFDKVIEAAVNVKYRTFKNDLAATFRLRELIDQINERFESYMHQTSQEAYVEDFNVAFRSHAPLDTKGASGWVLNALRSIGLASDFEPFDHQLEAVARFMQGGNLLLHHEVGFGKTFTELFSAMLGKRLGKFRKPVIVVQNDKIGDYESDLQKVFPYANALVLTSDDFEPELRTSTMQKIRDGRWDVVIMPQSSFHLTVPPSPELVRRTMNGFIAEARDAFFSRDFFDADQPRLHTRMTSLWNKIWKKPDKNKPSSGAAESLLKKVREHEDSVKRYGETLYWDDLGIDGLIYDESHYIKNRLHFEHISGVAGMSTSKSQRATDAFVKIDQINRLSRNQNVMFASATPVQNSTQETYVFMSYLAQDILDRAGLTNGDDYHRGFMIPTERLVPVSGQQYKYEVRYTDAVNKEVLQGVLSQVVDSVSGNPPGMSIPEVETVNIVALPNERLQRRIVQWIHNRRVHIRDTGTTTDAEGNEVLPRKLSFFAGEAPEDRPDHHFVIDMDWKLASIHPGLVRGIPEDLIGEHPGSRLDTIAQEVSQFYAETAGDRQTALVFLDAGVPKHPPPLPWKRDEEPAGGERQLLEGEEEEAGTEHMTSFNAYDVLADLMEAYGVSRDEIAFVQSAQTKEDMQELSARVNDGRIRVLIGSTAKGGVGLNVQRRLGLLVEGDPPFHARPSDLLQRLGRGMRHGNMNRRLRHVRIIMKGSSDERMYNLMTEKYKQDRLFLSGGKVSDDDGPLDFSAALIEAAATPLVQSLERLKRELRTVKSRIRDARRREKESTQRFQSAGEKFEQVTEAGGVLADGMEGYRTFTHATVKVGGEEATWGDVGGSLKESLGTPTDADAGNTMEFAVETQIEGAPPEGYPPGAWNALYHWYQADEPVLGSAAPPTDRRWQFPPPAMATREAGETPAPLTFTAPVKAVQSTLGPHFVLNVTMSVGGTEVEVLNIETERNEQAWSEMLDGLDLRAEVQSAWRGLPRELKRLERKAREAVDEARKAAEQYRDVPDIGEMETERDELVARQDEVADQVLAENRARQSGTLPTRDELQDEVEADVRERRVFLSSELKAAVRGSRREFLEAIREASLAVFATLRRHVQQQAGRLHTLGPQLLFPDREAFAAGLPHWKKAWRAARAAGVPVKEFMRVLRSDLHRRVAKHLSKKQIHALADRFRSLIREETIFEDAFERNPKSISGVHVEDRELVDRKGGVRMSSVMNVSQPRAVSFTGRRVVRISRQFGGLRLHRLVPGNVMRTFGGEPLRTESQVVLRDATTLRDRRGVNFGVEGQVVELRPSDAPLPEGGRAVRPVVEEGPDRGTFVYADNPTEKFVGSGSLVLRKGENGRWQMIAFHTDPLDAPLPADRSRAEAEMREEISSSVSAMERGGHLVTDEQYEKFEETIDDALRKWSGSEYDFWQMVRDELRDALSLYQMDALIRTYRSDRNMPLSEEDLKKAQAKTEAQHQELDSRKIAGKGGPVVRPLALEGTAGEADVKKAVHPQTIKHKLARAVEVFRIGYGKLPRWALGRYWPVRHMIRARLRGDVDTIFHEIGHAIDLMFTDWSELYEGGEVSRELMKVGESTSLPSYSDQRKRMEGVAEFVRRWLNGDHAWLQHTAPEFWKIFNRFMTHETLTFQMNEIREGLATARAETEIWQRLTPEQRAALSILRDQPRVGAFRRLIEHFRSENFTHTYLDDLRVLAKTDDEWYEADENTDRETREIGEGFSDLFYLLKGHADVAERFLTFGIVSRNRRTVYSKEGLYPILQRYRHKYQEIMYYVAARKADRAQRLGMESFMDREDRKKFLAYGKDPEVRQAVAEIDQFWRGMLDWLQYEMKLISAKTRKRWANRWEDSYVPFERVIDEVAFAAEHQVGTADFSVGKYLGGDRASLTFTGSYDPIIDPLKAMSDNTYTLVRKALENQAALALIQHADKAEFGANVVSVVPPDRRPYEFNLNQYRKQIIRNVEEAVRAKYTDAAAADVVNALEEDDVFLNEVVRLWMPNFSSNGKYLTARVGDKVIYAEVNHHLVRSALSSFRPQPREALAKTLGVGSESFRLGATSSPSYLQQNIFRDAAVTSITTQTGKYLWNINLGVVTIPFRAAGIVGRLTKAVVRHPFYVLGALWHLTRYNFAMIDHPAIRDMYLGGGGMSSKGTALRTAKGHTAEDASFVERFVAGAFRRRMARVGDQRGILRRSPGKLVDTLLLIRETIEYAPRVAEAMAHHNGMTVEQLHSEKGLRTIAYNARWSTQDFAVAGTLIRHIALVKPFLKSTIGGLNHIQRTIREPSTVARLAIYTTFLIYAWLMVRDDDEYQTIEEYDRENYTILPKSIFGQPVPAGESKFFRIPVIHEWSLPGKIMISAWDAYFNENPREYETLPFVGSDPAARELAGTIMELLLPHPLQGIVEASANYDYYRGREIVGKFETSAAEYQYNSYTSELAKLIGKALPGGMSPKLIDHLLYQYFATGGDALVDIIDAGLISVQDAVRGQNRPEAVAPPIRWYHYGPGVFRVTARPGLRDLHAFYARYDTLVEARDRLEGARQEGDWEAARSVFEEYEFLVDTRTGNLYSEELARLNVFRNLINSHFRELQDQNFADPTHTSEAKSAAENSIVMEIVNVARIGMGLPPLARTRENKAEWNARWRAGRIVQEQPRLPAAPARPAVARDMQGVFGFPTGSTIDVGSVRERLGWREGQAR